ncbi:uncharacterized protein DSM5745_07317 [Aspergillus mulundensis]|uniref:Heterokaryon incompatibility domain-containing protein n=1 Tax=Aspergillus mulundensis TaxID=1810919 RepID=A0A3D8RKS9_9EURO|nr:Uncharacterized protein DSM5745_07317 [Aspergillus mulundensis]RDW74655.1 Uncharacterized protein DSM5745_07317 [Aspergillus mulundensis]
MHRWHESGCQRPDVSAASGIPYCTYCFAIPSLEEQLVVPQPPPELQNRKRMNLSWPSIVTYSDWESEEEGQLGHRHSRNGLSELQSQKSLLPELPSEDSVRLLRLRPGSDNEPIHADFKTVRINQIPLPLYEALSYTSVHDPADPCESCPVYLGSYWDVFYVPRTCGKALRQLRHRRADRLLWVDALCIDQARLEEKNSQVRILREVFLRATKVLAYVGDEHPDVDYALSFLKNTIFHPTKTDYYSTLSKDARSSFLKLLDLPYFSRLWVLQETLMARELEFVCGGVSARWPQRSFCYASELGVPSWLLRDSKWYPFTAKDLLNVLVEGSTYQCTDPRDKVFALLGLMANKPIVPDYRLPTESVYVGIAAYFVKHPSTVDVLALAGQKNKCFDLPSWVPDWSQSMSRPSLDTFLRAGIRTDQDDSLLDGAIRVKFGGLSNSGGDIKVSSSTGTMQLQGFKFCTIAGDKNLVREYTHIQLPANCRGAFIISIPHQNYEIHESDSLFLLNGYRYPVILREITSRVYTLIAACVLSIQAPSSKLFVCWYRRQRRLGPSLQLSVSALTPEDDHSLQQLYSRLEPTHQSYKGLPTATTIRTRALSFLMLPHTTIQRVEKSLRVDWYKWNQELGWMFRDQSAIWQFLAKVNQLRTDERTGEDRIDLKGPDLSSLTSSGRDFSTAYFWDLSQFCWSFLHPTDTAQPAPQLQWSPILGHLQSHLPEIQKWAQVTEQLLRVFKYTASLLEDEWVLFPGSQLSRKWMSNYEKFLAVHGSTVQQEEEMQQERRPHLAPDHLWSASEFESQLRAREEIWSLRDSEERGSGDSNIEAHALLRFLGLDLYNEQTIDINAEDLWLSLLTAADEEGTPQPQGWKAPNLRTP